MVAHWVGTIEDNEPKDKQNPASYTIGSPLTIYSSLYPTYSTNLNNLPLQVEIGHFPGSIFKQSKVAATDSIHYLKIRCFFKCENNIQLTHENLEDRVEKFLHLTTEIQTNNPDFDRHFFIRSSNPRDRELLIDRQIQELIFLLEPFELVEMLSTGIHWSDMLTDKKQLAFDRVEKIITTMLKLAGTIQARTP